MYPIETYLEKEYLVCFMLSDTFLTQLSMTGNRVKMPKINKEELAGILILCPPLEDQQRIVAYISDQTKKIDFLIERILVEIEYFAEYRTRLISDVVTGKLDVRGVVVPEYEAVEETAETVEDETDEMESEE
jgi:type I restriction enzyme S subunit